MPTASVAHDDFNAIDELLKDELDTEQWFTKLLKLTENQPDSYLCWRLDQPRKTGLEKQHPLYPLECLQAADFRRFDHVNRLALLRERRKHAEIITLAQNEQIEYAVQTGDTIELEIFPRPNDDLQWCDEDKLDLSLFELRTEYRHQKLRPPTYVYDFGALLVRDLTNKTASQKFENTGYNVVVDVSQPKKPLWLVFNYRPINDLGEPSETDVPLTRHWHAFLTIRHAFDIAQLLPAVEDWNEKLTVETIERHVSDSAQFMEPMICQALEKEIALYMMMGWENFIPQTPMPL